MCGSKCCAASGLTCQADPGYTTDGAAPYLCCECCSCTLSARHHCAPCPSCAWYWTLPPRVTNACHPCVADANCVRSCVGCLRCLEHARALTSGGLRASRWPAGHQFLTVGLTSGPCHPFEPTSCSSAHRRSGHRRVRWDLLPRGQNMPGRDVHLRLSSVVAAQEAASTAAATPAASATPPMCGTPLSHVRAAAQYRPAVDGGTHKHLIAVASKAPGKFDVRDVMTHSCIWSAAVGSGSAWSRL